MTINNRLKEYIEQEIIPLYISFDRAHSTDHVATVIEQSLALAKHYDVDINMVYTIAAYHDTGLTVGREYHHIESGKILCADPVLKEFFSAQMFDYLSFNNIPVTIVATKYDKIKKSERMKKLSDIATALKVGVENIYLISSETSYGKDNLVQRIYQFVDGE